MSDGERVFGFGEHQNGRLDSKGLRFDFEQCIEYFPSKGGEVCLPWVLAADAGAVQYGFLWNNPSYGAVDFGAEGTTWSARGPARQIDFLVVTAPAAGAARAGAEIMRRYADAVGHAPNFPEWAAGYWHSKNRYATQDALLAAAEGFANRSVPVDIIVVDYHHWKRMGDWSFDNASWPDVPAMVDTLRAMGTRVMVSVWPFSATGSASIGAIEAGGLAVRAADNASLAWWNDNNCDADCYLYDPSLPAARALVWERVFDGYVRAGIDVFWLDASEPEVSTADAQAAADAGVYAAGAARDVGLLFPVWHTQTFYDGLVDAKGGPAAADGEIVMLTRSAWAGMSRHAAALWSGDTQSTFASLKASVPAALNAQLSGVAWWTSDVGGYAGGDPSDATFRELAVRWFQFGLVCPILRQHGARDTEIWLLGDEAEAAVTAAIALRAELKGYVMEQMARVAADGTPVNRPLWFDAPHDAAAWDVDDELMFGPDLLAAPVLEYGARNRTLYLPDRAVRWKHHYSGEVFAGGQTVTVDAPLAEFPLFHRLA